MTGLTDYRLADYQLATATRVRLPMAASAPESLSLQQLLQLAGSSLDQLFADLPLSYADSRGDEALREEIATDYEGLSADNILLFAGANEAIYAVNQVLLNRDDRLQVITPIYEPLIKVARQLGASISQVEMHFYEQKWQLDLQQWLDQLGVGTKLATINFPHNPTGAMLSRQQLQSMVERCRQTDCWLFADEVFRGLEFSSQNRLPAVASLYEKGISLGVLSKSLGLGGVRIGWVACQDTSLLDALRRFKNWLSVCHGQADAAIGLLAMQHRQTILQSHRQLLQSNLKLLENSPVFQQHLDWSAPSAGCVMFPRLQAAQSSAAFTAQLLDETGILLIPGSCFIQGEAHLRLGFGRRDLPLALQELQQFLKR